MNAKTWQIPAVALSLAALLVTGCGGDDTPSDEETTGTQAPAENNAAQEGGADSSAQGAGGQENPDAVAELYDQASNPIGTVRFTELEEGMLLEAEMQDLVPGFRALTVHETGLCEPQSVNDWGQVGDFYSAGGHLPGLPPEDPGVVEGEDAPEESPTPEGMDGQQEGADIYHPDHAGDLPNLLVNHDGTARMSVVTDRLSLDLLTSDDGAAVIVHAEADHHGNIPDRYAYGGLDYESLVTGDTGARLACGVVETTG
ncbi:superoxide dismutase family protein [Nesterenkonia flava]|uniref:Superoxide dismutase family protein n=1 Tax=Nesterenkonia flava TaxID=469799 RepID=A0ABU1FSC1_9MICC|nr:superoxide dismutase family protein [Nesterenkonia flava]MDR5711063.1 superoxide dismutase family protein [Nesterenkonia flava]